jgi:hypothetical protein
MKLKEGQSYLIMFILAIIAIILNIAQIVIGIQEHVSIFAIGAVAIFSGWFSINTLRYIIK